MIHDADNYRIYEYRIVTMMTSLQDVSTMREASWGTSTPTTSMCRLGNVKYTIKYTVKNSKLLKTKAAKATVNIWRIEEVTDTKRYHYLHFNNENIISHDHPIHYLLSSPQIPSPPCHYHYRHPRILLYSTYATSITGATITLFTTNQPPPPTPPLPKRLHHDYR